jgi:hypothetical protein
MSGAFLFQEAMIMEEYPVILDGKDAGRITVRRNVLMTEFDACAPGREGLLRLSVYGGGREGYLGVMEPGNGGLRLIRTLSASAMKNFPENIQYAGAAGEEPVPVPGVLKASASAPKPNGPEEGLLWFSTPEGVLTAFDGEGTLCAIPADMPRPPKGIARIINGREYLVFPGPARWK